MSNAIMLRIYEDDKIRKETKTSFGTYEKANECYREGQLAIRKCAGLSVEEMILRGNVLKNIEEDLENSLNKLENSVSRCNPNILDITDNIVKNLTIISERKRTGLLINVNQSKINDFEKKFKNLKNEFSNKCECRKLR